MSSECVCANDHFFLSAQELKTLLEEEKEIVREESKLFAVSHPDGRILWLCVRLFFKGLQ
jgi:hypothetical protein